MGSPPLSGPKVDTTKDPWSVWLHFQSSGRGDGQASRIGQPTPQGSSSTSTSATAGPSQRRSRPGIPHEESSSGRSRQSGTSWRWSSSWSSSAIMKKKAAVQSWKPSDKRCTYPPCSRVLRDEMQRITRRKKKGGLLSTARARQRRERKGQRHSLADVLSSFVHASSSSEVSTGPPYASVRSSMVLHLTDHDREVTRGYCPPRDDGSTDSSEPNSVRHTRAKRPRYGNDSRWLTHWTQWHARRFGRRHRKPNPTSPDTIEVLHEPTEKPPLLRHPTISSISSTSTTEIKPKHDKKPQRFSAFWYDVHGRSGKQIVEVDQRKGVTLVEIHSSSVQKHLHRLIASLTTQYSFFLCGFLFFPMWWIGAALYLTRPAKSIEASATPHQSRLLTSRTTGKLNCWMSALSVLLLGVVIAMTIWYHTSTQPSI